MHGEIELESELGQGTKTTFWITFRKAHIGTGDFSLVNLGSVSAGSSRRTPKSSISTGEPEKRNLSGFALSAHLTQLLAPAQLPLKSKEGSERAKSPQESAAATSKADSEAPPTEIDRKSIHVLVVEDK